MHDLALALGGMTVSELRKRMTWIELRHWHSYMKKNGPLNPMLRNEAAIARLGMRMAGGKPHDYAPWPREVVEEVTIEQVFAKLKYASIGNKK